MTAQMALRLPQELLARLDELVPDTHRSRSDAVRRAIEVYLYRLACEHDAFLYDQNPLTETELALADAPDAWSATPPW